MEKSKSKIKLTKVDKALVVIFSLAVTFSMCFFNQFDVLFRNQVEFGIQPQEVVLTFVLFAAIVFALSFLLFYFTARYSQTAFKSALSVALGFMLACYIQVLFLNNHYNGAFEDFAGDYKPITGWIKFYNLFIWLIVCLLPLALYNIQKAVKKDFFKKAALLSAVAILAMQAVGLGTAAPKADFRRYNDSFYMSVDQQLQLTSKGGETENIVVFILDRAAAGCTDRVFKAYPETKNNFEGFTYYKDNESEYSQTFPSVITMLTGASFEKTESRADFSKRAWENAILFDELHAKGYTVNGLIDELSTYYGLEDIAEKFDNIVPVTEERKVNQWQALRAMTGLSLQRTLPYALKEAVNFDYPDDLNRIVSSDLTSYFPTKVSESSDMRFVQKVNSPGLSANINNSTFSFVHLDCSHAFLDWRETTKKIYDMLGDYFAQMKRLEIFEKSTIILTADHGAPLYGTESSFKKSSLFIKRKGIGAGEMKTDTTTKLSNGFFLSTILELIGAPEKKPTTSYFDIIDKNASPERYYYDTSWDVNNHCKFKNKIRID